jgi:hypothetical protein
MKQANLTNKQKIALLQDHQCPYCGGYDLIYYNPNMTDGDKIQIEVECNNCPMYVIIVSELKTFYSNRED